MTFTPEVDGPVGQIVPFDRARPTRPRANGAAAPAVQVVIADGEALVRAGFRVLLEGAGRISVAGEAATGEEALELARRVRPDVVLMDASLPGQDSVEATCRIAKSGVAVLLLTARESEERIFAALRAGARGLLLKDAAPAELVTALHTLARGDVSLSPRHARRLIAELVSRPQLGGPRDDLLDELTTREREVMALVALGLSNDEIAERLVVTRATAKTHVSRVMIKLRARDRAQVVVLAYETGLVLPRTDAVAPVDRRLAIA